MAKGALIAVANMTMRDKDPTMTLTLRAKFVAQMNKRFRALKGAINKSIIDNDCFAIKKTVANVALTPLGAKTFQYTKDPEKVKGFMDWLKGEEEKGILEISMTPSMMGPTGVPWTNVYIQSAYQKGMAQARIDMKQGGAPIDTYTDQTLNMAFYQPFHADRVALIYTRAYNELKGVTEAMNQQISRELALGMARGDGPYRIAQLLNDRVDKIGIVRARLIARTETIHALNEAALNEYELLENMVGETVNVKWWTALDERVRSQHAAWHGKVMTRKVGRARIGAPNCRCALRPWLDSWDEEDPSIPERIRKNPVANKYYKDNPERAEKYMGYYDKFEQMFVNIKKERLTIIPSKNNKYWGYHYWRKQRKQIKSHLVNSNFDIKSYENLIKDWQDDTAESLPMAFKYRSSKIEKNNFFVPNPENVSEIMMEGYKKFITEDQYLQIRALNQAWMDQAKIKSIELFRGTDGKTGKKLSKLINEEKKRQRTLFNINENSIVGYSRRKEIADEFGIDVGGITIKKEIKKEDIIIHSDFLAGLTGKIRKEDEFIVIGGESKINIKQIDIGD